jgi:hypothetical protein
MGIFYSKISTTENSQKPEPEPTQDVVHELAVHPVSSDDNLPTTPPNTPQTSGVDDSSKKNLGLEEESSKSNIESNIKSNISNVCETISQEAPVVESVVETIEQIVKEVDEIVPNNTLDTLVQDMANIELIVENGTQDVEKIGEIAQSVEQISELIVGNSQGEAKPEEVIAEQEAKPEQEVKTQEVKIQETKNGKKKKKHNKNST